MKTSCRVFVLVACSILAAMPIHAQNKKNGEKVYNEYCATCHQKDGKGLPNVYPPLAKSDYVAKTDKETLLRQIIFGLSGKIKVNGKEYNGVMAPIPAKYKDADISDVATYALNMFGNSKGKITVDDVKAAKKKGKIK